MPHTFDAIVIGVGQAGPALAARLAGAGMRVAVVEKGPFGGTCVNDGCTPTKALVASAYAAHLARRAADYGVQIDAQPRVGMKRVKARKDAIVGKSSGGVERWMRGLKGGVGVSRPRTLHRREHRECRRRLAEVFRKAGFTHFRRAAETPFNLILEAQR